DHRGSHHAVMGRAQPLPRRSRRLPPLHLPRGLMLCGPGRARTAALGAYRRYAALPPDPQGHLAPAEAEVAHELTQGVLVAGGAREVELVRRQRGVGIGTEPDAHALAVGRRALHQDGGGDALLATRVAHVHLSALGDGEESLAGRVYRAPLQPLAPPHVHALLAQGLRLATPALEVVAHAL